MDPLSITGTVIAIAGLVAATNRAFQDLRTTCKILPGRLHALNNEVVDLEIILAEVRSAIDGRPEEALFDNEPSHIGHLLDQAKSKLQEVKDVVDGLISICKSTKIPLQKANAWRKNQPQLQALQEDIRSIKCSLNLLLGASHSSEMVRFRLRLESLSTSSALSTTYQQGLQDHLSAAFAQHRDHLDGSLGTLYDQMDQRIKKVEDLLISQAAQINLNQTQQFSSIYRSPSPNKALIQRPVRRTTQHKETLSPTDVGFRIARVADCRPTCPCGCHKESKTSSPALFDRVVGQMFLGYSGLPFLNNHCDNKSCNNSSPAHVQAEYWFPLGFVWSKILRVSLSYHSTLGPQFELSTMRRVPDSAQCVNFALKGDIDGLKDLFRRGLASPRDVSSTRGYSVLRWAMYGKQYQTCKFLLHAGADPDYRPIAASDNSPRNKAHQFLLMGGLSEIDAEALQCLTRGDDFIDEQRYTKLHRIVLGLSLDDLEEHVRSFPEEINTPDAMNRTPLAWAACRGDQAAIVTLLSCGAEVNTVDVQYSGIVGHAADRNYATCVRLLLEAGADPDIAAAYGYKVGNPLNVAARNASDPLIVKSLLDFGADVESCGVDGMTPLIHAARKNNASFASLLLEYGADINAVSKAGQTPLTTSIAYNSHSVLRLLLDRWFEYSECPRLKGPHLLQITALYADVETLRILCGTNHFLLKYDSTYALGDFASRLKERSDVNEKLVQAFEDLLEVIKRESPAKSPKSSPIDVEAGRLVPEDSDSETELFENAVETLYATAKLGESPRIPKLCRFQSKTF